MPARSSQRSDWLPVLLASAAVALAVAVLITLLRGESYWNFSDGVYAYTARALLDGGSLYTEVAAAQPPVIYLVGSGLLAISDSVMGLRLGLAFFHAATAVLAALAIYRLTGNRAGSLVGALLALLAPRTLHDFSNLLPETIGTPLVLAAAIAASRPKWSGLAGALGAIAILTKLPFVLPVFALLLFSADRRRFLLGGIATGIVLLLVFTAVFGFDFIEGTFLAQSGSGLVGLGFLKDELLQATWNLLPLLPLVVVGFRLRERALDAPLARSILAGTVGSLALFLTLLKHGTYINLAVAVEPFLVIVAVCGAVWALDSARRRAALGLIAVSLAFMLAQAGTLLLTPDAPEAFAQPFDSSNHGQIASADEVGRGADRLRAHPCDRSRNFYPTPFMAFAADIRMPGNQGDTFIISVSDVYEKQRELARSEACP